MALRGIALLFLLCSCLAPACGMLHPAPKPLVPPIEANEFLTTSRYHEIIDFLRQADKDYAALRLEIFGRSAEGRDLPLAVLGSPPPRTPADLNQRPVLFINANIHAGEVAGKEACLLLIRDLLCGDMRPLLENTVVLVAPIYNADGNERIDQNNRFWQPGPKDGVGIRTNAQSLDLNRDMMKLETPEAQALVQQVLVRWDPHLVVDCHTTNGSYHREPITYAHSFTPLNHEALTRFNRDELLPWAARRTRERHGYAAIPYGNFKNGMQPEEGWQTFDHKSRYVSNYIGLRNRLSVLIEMYVYADYEVRIRACRAFLESLLAFAAEHGEALRRVTAEADRATREGKSFRLHRTFDLEAIGEPLTIQGYEMVLKEDARGRKRPGPVLDKPIDYQVPYFSCFVATDEGTPLPAAYLFPRGLVEIRDKLQQHGIQVEERADAFSEKLAVFNIETIDFQENLYQGHRLQRLHGQWQVEEQTFPAGAFVVPADQPLFRVAATLLEPESDDGLACWNRLNRYLTRGNWDPRPGTFPVVKRPWGLNQ